MIERYAARLLFDGVALRENVVVSIEDGFISSLDPLIGSPDVHLVAPGFVDLQMNGYNNVDVAVADAVEFRDLDRQLLQAGTTSWLGTIVTAPLDRLTSSLARLDSYLSPDNGCFGFHVEGPFLGGAPGAHKKSWIQPFDAQWCEGLPLSVKLMTVAPEQQGVITGINALIKRGIRVSLGHTTSSREEWEQTLSSGATLVTHLFNGMSGVHHRNPGVSLWALNEHRVTAGLIADLVHVSADAIRLAFQAKGTTGIFLVSDSIAWNSQWAVKNSVDVRDGAPRLSDGTLAGSSTPLAQCVRHVVQQCGVSLEAALAAATSVPANLMGLVDVGRVAVGNRADLVILDKDLTVVEARRGLVSTRG